MNVTEAITRAVKIVGSQAKLGKAAGGFSQNAIWQAIQRNRVSPELARGIHHATRGAIPGSLMRPDLWSKPEDVPASPEQVAS